MRIGVFIAEQQSSKPDGRLSPLVFVAHFILGCIMHSRICNMVVHTRRHVSRTTFWFVDTDTHTRTWWSQNLLRKRRESIARFTAPRCIDSILLRYRRAVLWLDGLQPTSASMQRWMRVLTTLRKHATRIRAVVRPWRLPCVELDDLALNLQVVYQLCSRRPTWVSIGPILNSIRACIKLQCDVSFKLWSL